MPADLFISCGECGRSRVVWPAGERSHVSHVVGSRYNVYLRPPDGQVRSDATPLSVRSTAATVPSSSRPRPTHSPNKHYGAVLLLFHERFSLQAVS